MGKRISELPTASTLSADSIFAVSQRVGESLESQQATLAQLYSKFTIQVIHIAAGDTLDALTAPAGHYVFDLGSTMTSAPDIEITVVRQARLEVFEPGRAIRLSFWGEFDVRQGATWEFFPEDISGPSGAVWSAVGPVDIGNSPATASWTMEELTVTKMRDKSWPQD